MKPKYYLARILTGSMQYSSDYYTSYAKADQVRRRQVNPQQWMIIVNPIFNTKPQRVNMDDVEKNQWGKLKEAYKILQEFVY
jgi:hypothetical protein